MPDNKRCWRFTVGLILGFLATLDVRKSRSLAKFIRGFQMPRFDNPEGNTLRILPNYVKIKVGLGMKLCATISLRGRFSPSFGGKTRKNAYPC